MNMKNNTVSATFERFFYTSGEYHENHPMLYHRHKDFAELIYVIDGAGSYRVDNRIYELKPGNMVIVGRNIWHGEEPFLNNVVTYTCAIKNVDIGGKRTDSLIARNQRAVVELEVGCAIEKLMLALFEIQNSDDADRATCDSLCSIILRLVLDRFNEMQAKEEKTDQKNDELVRSITEYLDEHYAEELNLKELGSRFGLSHYYLAHLFKEETGVSPMKYVMHRKIGEVQNLLMNTDKNIQDIGDDLGFSSSCHLSAVFKKYFGISPKTYRQNFREHSKVAKI